MNNKCDICDLEHGYDEPCDKLLVNKPKNINEILSGTKRDFYIDKRNWDEQSKIYNSKVLEKHITERVIKPCEVDDGIIGVSYKVKESVAFRGL